MSQSLASAKKRRAPAADPPRPPMPTDSRQMQQGQTVQNMQAGLTLPQVIQLVDRRLINLEQFMNETKLKQDTSRDIDQPVGEDIASSVAIQQIATEFDKRYELLAEEIVNLKNIVLSLQSYTMEVNKTLMEERVRIFSDLEAAQNSE
jgi:hypothetical protein